MTEARNSQMTRSALARDAGADQEGWGATTTAGAAAPNVTAGPTTASRADATTSAASSGRAAKKAARQPRRARLALSHINIYSVFKLACVLAVALFLVWLIVVGVLYGILDVAGALHKVNSTVQEINGGNSKPVISGSVVFGAAILIGVVNMVLFIAVTTVGAMIYNVCSDLVGGAELTLSERE